MGRVRSRGERDWVRILESEGKATACWGADALDRTLAGDDLGIATPPA